MSLDTAASWAAVLIVLAVSAKPVGTYMARVFTGQRTVLDPLWLSLEHRLWRWAGVDLEGSMTAVQYGTALLLANLAWVVLAYLALRLQSRLPFNPEHFGSVGPLLAFNTAVSFVTNTNFQAYAGENTLSYFSQFGVLGYLQFVSPAVGLAAMAAFLRALGGQPLGNFYRDLTRAVTRLLLPFSVVLALILMALGIPETLAPYVHLHLLAGGQAVLPRGPIASWEAIAHLGTNGGGYTAANSANPLENPSALTNLVEIIAMGLLPVASVYAFGVITGRPKVAWTLMGVAGAFYFIMLGLAYFPELYGNPVLTHLGLASSANWVGKELRFGLGGSALFQASSLAFTTGSVNAAVDSYLPLSTLGLFLGMFLNMVFGGDGIGLLNLLMFVILTVFLMGLMVGRTPEFLGKKLETKEVSLTSLAFLVHPLIILGATALAIATPAVHATLNHGPRGLMEILYAFTSSAANNGSAMGGLNAAQPFYLISTGVVMLLGRYLSILFLLLVAESLQSKKALPETQGTMHTDTWLFGGALFSAIVILNALTFLPVMALGPIAESYLLGFHRLF